MTLQFSKKEKMIGAIGITVIVLLLIGLYFLYIQPMKTSLSNKQKELETEKQLLSAIENQLDGSASMAYDSTLSLQNRIPVKPLADQLMLDIEKAEVVSNSFVKNMEFADEDLKASENSQEEAGSIKGETESKNAALPHGIKKLIVTLTVQSPAYIDMETFIDTLEQQKRIISVENIAFSGMEEMVSDNKNITYQIRLAAFYMPDLTNLAEDLPQAEIPEPSHKKDPFSSSVNQES